MVGSPRFELGLKDYESSLLPLKYEPPSIICVVSFPLLKLDT